MNVRELRRVLDALVAANPDTGLNREVRIGDQVESGQYLHASVGGVYQGTHGAIILTANDDEVWHDEGQSFDPKLGDMPCLWKP